MVPASPSRSDPETAVVEDADDDVRPLTRVRCECLRCGAHVIATRSYSLGGYCGNCGSYELRVLDESI
jgi:Zn finger protein HypA/HybF involved in hydrogenase expression